MIMPYNSIDYNFFQNFGIELAAGRYFDKNYAKDTLVYANEQTPVTQANIIINQMAAKKFGWSDQQAIGKTLNYNVSFDGKTKTEVTVVGVVKDYHFESVREELKPIVHFVNKTRFYYLALKLDNKDVSGTIAAVENTWKKLFPTQDFSYSFLDDNFNAMYEDEKRVSGVYGVFSILAVCIACLGLFGLASFTTERRTKEIGVRKVLGASSQSIVLLLTKEFSKLVLLASAFAWPVAWYLMNDWLQNFAFSIELSMGSFLIGTIMALIVAWFTVGGQAAKAAMARPVDSLKYE
ncbi:MAG: ABC transporter permease [Alteromonadaceae bacterium]|nr:ABC transporter permease [Alteromonadaceae bacterium]